LERLEALEQQAFWLEWVEAARARKLELENRLWRAESRGLAQAEFQSWFTRKLHALKLDQLQVDTEVAGETPEGSGLWQVAAEVKGSLSRRQLVDLLKTLELHENLIRIEHLQLKRAGEGLRVALKLSSFFQAVVDSGGTEA
jgi:hypothetical protein